VILVFGAGGQSGQSLIEEGRRIGVPMIGHTRAQTDINNFEAVCHAIATTRPTLVVNAAAYTAVDRAESDAGAADMVNALGPGVVARATAAADVPMMQISTDYVFDGTKTNAYREEDPIAPISIYGWTKAKGEEAVRRANPRHIILRTSWLHGPYGQNFLKIILRLAASREELRVVSDQRGCPTSTTELARAILRTADRLAAGATPFGTYHFTGRGETTWHGLAVEIVNCQAETTGLRPRVVPIASEDYPTAARRPANSTLDSSRFASVFDYPAESWQAGVRSAIDRLFSLEVAA
jgi:dTDP-4-dehydrorhamnose reductase